MTPGTDWIDQARRVLDALRGGSGDAAPTPGGDPAAAHDTDCRWCPICQVASVVRGERPEVTAALADVLSAAATALRAFAADGGEPQGAPDDAEPTAGAGDPPPTVQRIEIA
jgi:hypothetical protein